MSFARANLPRWTAAQYRQRPNDFDPGVAETVCRRAANGELLAEICVDLDMPFPATFLAWTRSDPDTGKLWRQAQLDRLDVMSEESVLIADTDTRKNAGLSISTRQWMAERLNPKKFSQRNVSVGVTGDDDADAGVDYGQEVRRKLSEMAERRKESAEVVESAE